MIECGRLLQGCDNDRVSEQEPTSVQPGMVGARRYPRTFGGLIASTVVLVLGVGGFALLNHVFHGSSQPDNPAVTTSQWQAYVTEAQGDGLAPLYPATIPSGWWVNAASFDNNTDVQHPRWLLGITNGTQYVGIYEQQASATSIESTIVGPGEVFRTIPGNNKYTAVLHGTSQALLDQFAKSLTSKKLPAS